MLKKLMKYELLLYLRRLVFFYAVFVCFSLLCSLIPQILVEYFDSQTSRIFNEILFTTYFCIGFYGLVVPFFKSAIITKRLMFSDEAYLVKTLPVKNSRYLDCHIIVTLLVSIANFIVISFVMGLSLTDNSFVSLISSSFIGNVKILFVDIGQFPAIAVIVCAFIIVTMLLTVITQLCLQFIVGSLDKREKYPKLIIVGETALLVVVLMCVFPTDDTYETLAIYSAIFALASVIEGKILYSINRKNYNLR